MCYETKLNNGSYAWQKCFEESALRLHIQHQCMQKLPHQTYGSLTSAFGMQRCGHAKETFTISFRVAEYVPGRRPCHSERVQRHNQKLGGAQCLGVLHYTALHRKQKLRLLPFPYHNIQGVSVPGASTSPPPAPCSVFAGSLSMVDLNAPLQYPLWRSSFLDV